MSPTFFVSGPQLPTLCRGSWARCCPWTVSGLQVPQRTFTLSSELAATLKPGAHSSCHSCRHTPASSMLTFPLWAFLLCFSLCLPAIPLQPLQSLASLGDRQAEEERGQRLLILRLDSRMTRRVRVLGRVGGGGAQKVDFEAEKVPRTKSKPELQKGVGGLSGGRGRVVWAGLGQLPVGSWAGCQACADRSGGDCGLNVTSRTLMCSSNRYWLPHLQPW